MCSDPLDPGAEVRGCSVSWTLSMWDIPRFRAASAFNVHREFPEEEKSILGRVCSVCGKIWYFIPCFFLFERTRLL